jgi:hypothetical protein
MNEMQNQHFKILLLEKKIVFLKNQNKLLKQKVIFLLKKFNLLKKKINVQKRIQQTKTRI